MPYLAVGRVLDGPSHVAALDALDAHHALVNSLDTPEAACEMESMDYGEDNSCRRLLNGLGVIVDRSSLFHTSKIS